MEVGKTLPGQKDDSGKLPMHLLDRTALNAMAAVLQVGAAKYGSDNWRGGIEYTRLISAAMRHLHALNDCEDLDPETGELHAAHAMCSLMFLIWMMRCRPDLDDRWRGPPLVPVESPANQKVSMIEESVEEELKELAKKFAPIVQEIKTND